MGCRLILVDRLRCTLCSPNPRGSPTGAAALGGPTMCQPPLEVTLTRFNIITHTFHIRVQLLRKVTPAKQQEFRSLAAVRQFPLAEVVAICSEAEEDRKNKNLIQIKLFKSLYSGLKNSTAASHSKNGTE